MRVFLGALMSVATVVGALALAPAANATPAAGAGAAAVAKPPTKAVISPSLTQQAQHRGTVPVIVTLAKKSDQQPVLNDLKNSRQHFTLKTKYKRSPLLAMRVDKRALSELANTPGVKSVGEDKLSAPQPVDKQARVSPKSVKPADFDTMQLIKAGEAHQLGFTGQGQTIAILSDGVQAMHPLLSCCRIQEDPGGQPIVSKVVAEACFSNGGGAGQSLCPNQQPSQTGTGAADPTATSACRSGDTYLCTHGTYAAGLAAGKGELCCAEVAPDANIMAIQIYTRFNGAAQCAGAAACLRSYESDQISGLEEVAAASAGKEIAGADLDVSSGDVRGQCGDPYGAYDGALYDLESTGTIPVVPAGDSGGDGASRPACALNNSLIAAGATDTNDHVAPFSNYGDLVVGYAPGVDVISAEPEDSYASASGTGVAAALFTGALAVYDSAYPNNPHTGFPAEALVNTGAPVTYPAGCTNPCNRGKRLDLLAAVQDVAPPQIHLDHQELKVNEGSVVTTTGTYLDPDGHPITFSAPYGTVTDTGGGHFTWTYRPTDGPDLTKFRLTATDDRGVSADSGPIYLTVDNVGPSTRIDPDQVTTITEGDTLNLQASFSDPGTLDTHTAKVAWEGSCCVPATVTESNGSGTVTGSHQYTVAGTYSVDVQVTDNDGGTGHATFNLTVKRAAPVGAVDTSGAPTVNGTPTLTAPQGKPTQFTGTSTDPKGRALTLSWDWGDATAPTTTNYPADPARTKVTDTQSHTYAHPGVYDVKFTAADELGTATTTTQKVVVTGTETDSNGSGYWWIQTRSGSRSPIDVPQADLTAYLQIGQQVSSVFSEAIDISTQAKAHAVLFGGTTPKAGLDENLLAAWLNFADGSIALTTEVDANLDGDPDTTFAELLTAAEKLRLDPATTAAQLRHESLVLQNVNAFGG